MKRPVMDPGNPHGLDIETLRAAARDYAHLWTMRDQRSRNGKRWIIGGPSYVMQCLQNATYKDEFEYLVNDKDYGIKAHLNLHQLKDFEARAKEMFAPREDKVFVDLLAKKLAITPDGKHIDGAIGTVQVGIRPIMHRPFEVETLDSLLRRRRQGLPIHAKGRTDRETEWKVQLETWPVYAGEAEERSVDSRRPDPLPEGAYATLPDGRRPGGLSANVTNFSAESIIAALDAIRVRLDEGSTAATIRLRTGSQPADPDATETGTLLGTLTCSDPAVSAAVDDTDGTCSATFDTISDDASADATNTVGYCRVGATGTGADDHIDGNAATSDAAFVFNTTAIVSGATISISSAVIGMSQGSTAS